MTQEQSSVNRNTIEVSKSHPCPHCGKPNWCYVLSDGNMSACKRGSEPGAGWYATGAKDKDGTPCYATIASRDAWKAARKAKSGGETVSTTTYKYRVASAMSGGDFFTHLGLTDEGLYAIEVVRRNYKNGGKDIRQRSGEPWAPKNTWEWKVPSEWRENIPPFFTDGSYYSLLGGFQGVSSETLKGALEDSNQSHFFIVEGEKCANSFSGKGVALCNYGSGGKSKWKGSDTQFLISMFKYQKQGDEFVERPDWQEVCPTLVLTPDRDKVGLDHMVEVYQSLVDAGYPLKKISWFFCYNERNWYDLELSRGLDIADMFDENPNLTVEQLLSKVKTTEECPWLEKYFRSEEPEIPSSPLTDSCTDDDFGFADTFLTGVDTEVEWFIQDLLPTGYSVVLSGQSGAGKSVSAFDLGVAVASGGTWLGKQCKQGKVLILNNDQSVNVLRRMLKTRIGDDVETLGRNIAVGATWVANDEGLEKVRRAIAKHQFSLVIMDSVRECICHPLGISQNDEETGYKLKQVAEIVTATGACFIALHHESKSKERTGVEKAAGSTSIISNVDAHWRVTKANDVSLTMPKTRGYSPTQVQYSIDFGTGICHVKAVAVSGEKESAAVSSPQTAQDRVLAYLEQADDGVSNAELVEELGEKESTVKMALKRLIDQGLVESYPNPEKPKFKLYRAVEL